MSDPTLISNNGQTEPSPAQETQTADAANKPRPGTINLPVDFPISIPLSLHRHRPASWRRDWLSFYRCSRTMSRIDTNSLSVVTGRFEPSDARGRLVPRNGSKPAQSGITTDEVAV
jgi:hypothetical protein